MADSGSMPGVDFTYLREQGFEGFLSVATLNTDRNAIPKLPGVYLVLRPSMSQPHFLAIGTGGHFKGRDPNVDPSLLQDKWLPGEHVLYIGKAGGAGSDATLHGRITTYLAFGRGVRAGHQGGCYIWQLEDAQQLLFCWKSTRGEEPATVEGRMIAAFKQRAKRWPFANRRD
jgi:hypothetical protein